MSQTMTAAFEKNRTRLLVFTAMMTALVFVGTYSISIPVPFTSGYIHLGDSMVVISGLLLGPFYGAFAAGVGSALTDAVLGYTFWIIPTLIIKGLMGFAVGYLTNKMKNKSMFPITAIYTAIWVAFTGIAYFLINRATEGSTAFQTTLDGLQADAGSDVTVTASEVVDAISRSTPIILGALIAIPVVLFITIFIIHKVNKKDIPLNVLIAYIIAGTFMCIGYYAAYGILTGNFYAPIVSIPFNMGQFIGGFVIAVLVTPIALYLKKLFVLE
jgi:uncharacterized membrane protein